MCPAALALGALLWIAVVLSWPALAQTVARRRIGVGWDEGARPLVSFSARDLADVPTVREQLRSGLPQTLVLRLWARAGADDDEIARTARLCRVVYDLWTERWRVEVRQEARESNEQLATLDAVLDRCLVARELPVGRPAEWEGRSGRTAYFAVLVELNPLSRQTVRSIKRWLARPGGGLDGGDAFFGSFVALFVNRRVEQAERSLGFRSQEVVAP